ncbi:recombinase family protein [Devosia oryziradicis]|uniref:Recombinase family protein n=1 Tax=Devosia oryziradicis TaxID=2801335 RepID=A0ABX7BXD2_9HYPH|nr:recombinase family protein [Devosia oryziradicis]
MELVIRKLRKHGVEVASVTQPNGDDPSAAMIRQIIGIFDEYTSKENGRQVTRAMTENARQGFWNGASPPLGYTIVEAERRGQKIKKKLAIDPVEAEVVRLIFRLYLEGDAATGKPPMGIKEVVKWLNGHGYRTKKGGTFGVGPLHHILTNKAYIGSWHYHSRNSRSGGKHPEGEVVEVPVPAILDEGVFHAAQAKLAANNPRVSPVRAISGPILLTGIATCSHCGGGMTQRTGTSATGRVYAYYTCATRAQKGATACKGNTIPMAYLDEVVRKALDEKLFAPERLAALLTAVAARRSEKAEANNARLVALQVEVDTAKERLQRLYTLVEDGLAEMDDLLCERITVLKADREKAQAALDRARRETGGEAGLDPEKIAAFSKLMRDVLASSDNPTRKAYLRSLLNVEVGPEKVRIMGSRETLYAAAGANNSSAELVQLSGLKWRARRDSNS